MRLVKCLDKDEVIERGINALYKEFGPAETRRFMTLTHPKRSDDSVIRHRKRQRTISRNTILKEMRAAYNA